MFSQLGGCILVFCGFYSVSTFVFPDRNRTVPGSCLERIEGDLVALKVQNIHRCAKPRSRAAIAGDV